jgi:LmbE family N-acetylglucosaminyl deacetylase
MTKILILSAHVDDAEIGMGGTIAKLAENEDNIIQSHALSGADKSLPKEFKKGTLATEAKNAAFMLGLTEFDQHKTWNFETREFPRDRQRVLDLMIQLKQSFNPDVVYCPNYDDMHQDHKVLAEEAMRAFKHKTLIMYQLIWNSRTLKLQHISVLQQRHVSKKTSALKQFESQKRKRYMGATNIISQLRTVGLVADTEYAEAFEVVRYVDG